MPVVQSPSPAQVVRQRVAPLHMYGAQLCVVWPHAPVPQVPARVSVEPFRHDAGAQIVPSAYFWQPPAPSHLPFVPQLGAPWSAQNAAGAGVPAPTGVQVPLPERLHA